jgi:hypothetical protein
MFAGDRRKYSEDVNLRLDQGIESVSSALIKTQRTDIPVAPATPVMVQQLIRSTKLVLNENQKAFVLAGQNILSYDSGRAIGRFPELLHLDTSQRSLLPPSPTVVPDHDQKPRTIKRPSRKRIKKPLKKPKKKQKKPTR